jgi:hypothetical protein
MSIKHVAFYPADQLGEISKMTAPETGVYFVLFSLMCQAEGPFKVDVDRLYRTAGCKTKSAFNKILGYLIEEGKVTINDGFLSVKSAERQIEVSIIKSSKAKTAIRARWDKESFRNKDIGNTDVPPKNASKNDVGYVLGGIPEGYLQELDLDLDLDLDLEVEVRTSTTQEKAVAAFQIFLETHPRPVDTRKGLEKFMEILASGVPSETLIQAAANYAESVVNFSERAKVQQSDNFLDDDRGLWRDHVA